MLFIKNMTSIKNHKQRVKTPFCYFFFRLQTVHSFANSRLQQYTTSNPVREMKRNGKKQRNRKTAKVWHLIRTARNRKIFGFIVY